ncbi:hypothetical protein FZC76_06010 [Sutcliffiella horikoshii]|uniref:Uncharacterized protein n=1 Tax=Sutcliffiella horikoshii TaxID=79883 RepID=A0A5D4T2J5_9BACI|nr:hypothetical protein [Sutcliffiella horikoshii]TYS69783.1 hypothetical protein FZC76_06010 [Sutcliffiella horikoshii]
MRRFSVVFLLIFTITTILTFFLVYKEVNHPFATAMVGGYAMFLIISLCYFLLAILWKASKLSRIELRRRLRRFIFYFVVIFGMSFLIKFSNPDYYKTVSIAFGISLGVSFFDLALPLRKTGIET